MKCELSQLALMALACSLLPEVVAQPVLTGRQPGSILESIRGKSNSRKYECNLGIFEKIITGCTLPKNKKTTKSEKLAARDESGSAQLLDCNDNGVCSFLQTRSEDAVSEDDVLEARNVPEEFEGVEDPSIENRDVPAESELIEDPSIEARGIPVEFVTAELKDSEE